jgi:hypothetical protein
MPIKYYQIKHSYIEEIGTGAIRKYHNREIREGRAILVATAYQRLKRALQNDQELLKFCQQTAIKYQHTIFGGFYWPEWLRSHETTEYRRLLWALETDDCLMASCIKEAATRGHVIY